MDVDDIEAAALLLDPRDRARLAKKLLTSLESLSEAENERLWIEEAEHRDEDLDADPAMARSADEVFRYARAKIV